MTAAGEGEQRRRHFEFSDGKPSPEQEALLHDSQRRAGERVDEFLNHLSAGVRGKARQYERILAVLWHCHLSREDLTQVGLAAHLGVSDSLTSDYRRRIERALRSLSLASVEEARSFEEALLGRVKGRVGACATPAGEGAACTHVALAPPAPKHHAAGPAAWWARPQVHTDGVRERIRGAGEARVTALQGEAAGTLGRRRVGRA